MNKVGFGLGFRVTLNLNVHFDKGRRVPADLFARQFPEEVFYTLKKSLAVGFRVLLEVSRVDVGGRA